MNWSLIVLGLVAISSVAIAENSYLVIVPKLLKVGFENQLSVFIAAASQPVEVKFELLVGQQRVQGLTTVKSGETHNATLALPLDFPVGPGVLTIVGTGGLHFEDKRDVIVYDNRFVVLVQTSASSYQPGDKMEIRVVATNEELIPLEQGELLLEIYDANLKLVGEFPGVAIRSGLTENIVFPICEHSNVGTWIVSATINNSTSSVEVLVAKPVTPSFDLKAIFQKFLLRTDTTLRGVIEIDNDSNEPIFGRALIAVGQVTEEDIQTMMKEQHEKMVAQQQKGPKEQQQEQPQQQPLPELWRKWKSQQVEIAGRIEINYELLSLFNVDVSKALAVQVYIQVTDLASGQERFIQHVIPVFTRDVIYDIRPLEFEAGIKNEFEIIAKRPDGKPAKMENLIVGVTMILGDDQGKVQDQKVVEIKDFYTRGRNDIGLFNVEIPLKCIGVLMTIIPLSEDGQVRGYRTHAIPLMPTPRRGNSGGKLTIELASSSVNAVNSNGNAPVVSTQIATVGRTANFYVQVIPSKVVEKMEPLPVSWMLLTNGRITLTGELALQPTKECQSKAQRSITPEQQAPPTCVFNGTLPIQITRAMIPYSTLLVYTFQPSFGFNVAESYRFSVAGLFQNSLTLNATIVPVIPVNTVVGNSDYDSLESLDSSEDVELNSVSVATRAQGKTGVELSFTGAAGSTVGLNVIEYDGITQGLQNEVTKERLLQYLTSYEQVPIIGMPTWSPSSDQQSGIQTREADAEDYTEEEARGITIGLDDLPVASDAKREADHADADAYSASDSASKRDYKPRHRTSTHYRSSSVPTKSANSIQHHSRAVVSEDEEEHNIVREQNGFKYRYPVEKMVLGLGSNRNSRPVEGDDTYTTPSMGRLYGDAQSSRPQSHYRRRIMKSSAQNDVSVDNNEYAVVTSLPLFVKAASGQQQPPLGQPNQPDQEDTEAGEQGETPASRAQGSQYGTPAWYEKMNSKLNLISQEAVTFMQSGLSIVTDFSSLRVPTEMQRTNLTGIFSTSRHQSAALFPESFSIRDEARQLLEEYLAQTDLSMIPPPVVLEEQARIGYYRSAFFNTSRIESQGTGKVVIPRIKPYSTWLATGFALNAQSGLSVAQPIRLPANQGLFILANFPEQVQIGEHILLTYGVNNYLGKDLSNVVVRIRASADFDLIEQSQSERAASSNGKDYTITIPSLKALGVEIRNVVLVPKRSGVVKILLEVESEFGGDHEVLTTFVRESGIERQQLVPHFFDLTSEKKFGPIVEQITQSPALRSVKIGVSGTGLDSLIEKNTLRTSPLVGVDRAIIRLWSLLGVRRYLNETSQLESPLFNQTTGNLSCAYQDLQIYNDYNGSYSFVSDQGIQQSSLYLTSLAFGALISPFAPVRDNVTINRTLSWLLSRQQQDGSFDDEGPCFHYRFCSGPFRTETLTALVLYTFTRNNVSEFVPEFVRQQLYQGEQSPVARAQRYLQSRRSTVKPCFMTTTLVDLALVQCSVLPVQLREQIFQDVRSRQLTVVSQDGSRFLKSTVPNPTVDDEILLNSLTLAIYATMGDLKTTSEIARWIVTQTEVHPQADTVLDAVFRTEAWLKTDCLFRQRFGSQKVSVIVDVTADNGQKQQFKIDSSNMDVTQRLRFTLPVKQISYTVSGFGSAFVWVRQIFIEQQQPQTNQPTPFQLTNEIVPMPWLSELTVRTCVTYTPTQKEQQLAKDTFNRTVIVDFQIPTGMRVNLRQVGFFLSRVPEAMYFTYNKKSNSLSFFLNVPSTAYGKQICLDWCLERLSFVSTWAPIVVRAYDYLHQDNQVARLVPIQLQPNLLGYSFVDAVIKARPTVEQLSKIQPKPVLPGPHGPAGAPVPPPRV